jgi:hypothetical protein
MLVHTIEGCRSRGSVVAKDGCSEVRYIVAAVTLAGDEEGALCVSWKAAQEAQHEVDGVLHMAPFFSVQQALIWCSRCLYSTEGPCVC